ncbi:MAG: hypothetical protein NTX93_06885 [Bacteroidia bacterium]|nr:hypothetical protein [Bacteroidia bacterium]
MESIESYENLLRDPRWINKRTEIFERDKYQCCYCKNDRDLVVHHIFYFVKKLPWEYPNELLVTLCEKCHKHWHDLYGVEYCSEDGRPLTLFLGGPATNPEVNSSRYFDIHFEARDEMGKVVYTGTTRTWNINEIEVDIHGTPLNCFLSHKMDGVWLIPTDFCDGYHFKNMILKQLKLKNIINTPPPNR